MEGAGKIVFLVLSPCISFAEKVSSQIFSVYCSVHCAMLTAHGISLPSGSPSLVVMVLAEEPSQVEIPYYSRSRGYRIINK
jgi:hypothetical protein